MNPSAAQDAYLESKILAGDPLDLIRILYRTALVSVGEAQASLTKGDVAGRARSISRALEAVAQLNGSLNHEAGGDLSRRLAGLYDYIQQRLLQANFEQAEGPLIEAAGLLTTLLEAWERVKVEPEAARTGRGLADSIHWGMEEIDGALVSASA